MSVAMLGSALAAPATALADEVYNNVSGEPVMEEGVPTVSADTKVTLVADTSNIKFRVPTVIPFVETAAGELTGPDAEATLIENLSYFPIHVISAEFDHAGDWKYVEAADYSGDGLNEISFQLAASSDDTGVEMQTVSAFDMAQGAVAIADGETSWTMTAETLEDDAIQLDTTGAKMSVTNHDLTGDPEDLGTITFKAQPGNVSNGAIGDAYNVPMDE